MRMISDEERREVAAKLRKLAADDFGDGEYYACGGVENALGLVADGGGWYEAAGVRRLADLIDRPKAKREDAGDYWRCKHCGAFTRTDALTDLVGFMPAHRCGNCGREWEL